MATIIKRKGKNGTSYLIRAYSGYDINGKQVEKTTTYKPETGMTARQIDKAVQEAAVLFEKRVKDGIILDGNIRFIDFTKTWLQNYAFKQLAPKTIERYKSLLVKINMAIGNIPLEKLRPHHLQEFYNNLEENGVNEGSICYVSTIDLPCLLKEKKIQRVQIARDKHIATNTVLAACKGLRIRKESAEAICQYLSLDFNSSFREAVIKPKLADLTILHYHRLIGTILQTAVQWQVIYDNPARRVKPPRVKRYEAKYLEDTDIPIILKALDEQPLRWRTIIMLLLSSGMRRGELCGLEWRDIDFENSVIHISRTSQYVVGMGVIEKETKNISSERVLKLPSYMFDTLREYKSWQNKMRLALGDYWHKKITIKYADGTTNVCKNDRVFTSDNGEPIFPDTITQWVNKFQTKYDLPKFTPHTLRHTNISLLIAAGVPLRNVSQRAGHSQLSTTSNIYAHAIKTVDEIAAEALDDALNPMKVKTGKATTCH